LPLALLEVESARETVALDLRTVPKKIEKRPVGERWAALGRGRALFAMLFKEERGREGSRTA